MSEPNYFNYFTEIEDEFVRRRGRHILISPLDWSLIEMWKTRGIPLDVVLRGINSSFDNFDKASRKRANKVNSLLYCQQAVEAQYEQYCGARVGSKPEGDGSSGESSGEKSDAVTHLTPDAVKFFLTDRRQDLNNLLERYKDVPVVSEALSRSIERLSLILDTLSTTGEASPERLESDLTQIESILFEALKEACDAEELAAIRREGQSQLKRYRAAMSKEIYEQTLNTFLARTIRDKFELPRLSLYYL